MGISEKFKSTIHKYSMLLESDHVLTGLSGGPDSVCLLAALNYLKPEFNIHLSAAYIDHGLRPDETHQEIKFCRKLCESFNIPFYTESVDVKAYVKQTGMNKQEAARELRYLALGEIAVKAGANKIALGHNADDQAETILMRIFRGTGPSGLSGIPPVRNQEVRSQGTAPAGFKQGSEVRSVTIIRPLIEIARKEIEDFLMENASRLTPHASLPYMVDSSNLKDDYLRNKIRHLIMPAIKDINRDVVNTISRSAEILRDEERYFEIIVTKSLMKLISRKTNSCIELFSVPMESMDVVIVRRVLRRAIDETRGLRGISFTHIEDIINLIKKGRSGDRIYLPKDIRVIKKYSTLLITSEKPLKLGIYVMDKPGEIVLKESSIVIHSEVIDFSELRTARLSSPKSQNSELNYGDGKKTVLIDADKAQFPLLIRARNQGDFLYPLGLGGRKKIQDYFVDEKIPRDERDIIPLLICDDNIVWVIGYRLDERYKVDKDTKRVLKLEIKQLKF